MLAILLAILKTIGRWNPTANLSEISMKFEQNPLERKLLTVKEFHNMTTVLLAILETMNRRKPICQFVLDISESDACMKSECNLLKKKESYCMSKYFIEQLPFC